MSSVRGGAFTWAEGLATLSYRTGFFWPMSVNRMLVRVGLNLPCSVLHTLGIRFVLADDVTPEETFAEIRRGPVRPGEWASMEAVEE